MREGRPAAAAQFPGCFMCDKEGVTLQVTPTNVDIASVAPYYHLYTKEEIEEVISRL